MPRWQPDGARFDYFMNFQDAPNEEFLERLRGYVGPANVADMSSNAELVLPDLQKRGFILPWGPGSGNWLSLNRGAVRIRHQWPRSALDP